MRALIADDDRTTCRLIQALLVRWGFEVDVCRDGDQAWALLQQGDGPRLLVLDRMMPGVDGLELCRRVRARRDGPAVYVLLLTSLDRKEDMVEGLAAGADDYVTKPCYREELEIRVANGRRFLELHDELDRLRALHEAKRAG